MIKGVIVKGVGGFYYVKSDSGVYRCRARGVFKKEGIAPLVGDCVEIEVQREGDAVVSAIADRKNQFIRPQVSNVDCFILVISAARPEPNFSLADRFLVLAEKAGTDAMICVNKIDLADEAKLSEVKGTYEGLYPVHFVSALTGEGMEEFKASLKNEKYVLAGPSGAGKSTLLNSLEPRAAAETGEISRKTLRGKHTTRHVEIFDTGFGAMIFDTPGFTSFEAVGVESGELQHLYPEIGELYGKCRYKNCAHLKEAGCAVREAVTAGDIRESRYSSYKEIYAKGE